MKDQNENAESQHRPIADSAVLVGPGCTYVPGVTPDTPQPPPVSEKPEFDVAVLHKTLRGLIEDWTKSARCHMRTASLTDDPNAKRALTGNAICENNCIMALERVCDSLPL